MKTNLIATLQGAMNTSLDVLLSTVHHVGDILDISNVIRIVPHDADTTRYFKAYVDFCEGNGESRYYRIDSIEPCGDRLAMQVSPAQP